MRGKVFPGRLVGMLVAVVVASLAVIGTAGAYTLDVSAWIDGRSLLVIQGSTVKWHNLDYTVPGKHSGHNDPTYLTTVDMGEVAWYPTWSSLEGNTWSTNQFNDLDLPLASSDHTVAVRVVTARNYAGIYQQPSASNGYTLIIDFNDNPSGGPTWYSLSVNYDAVPEPASMLLLGIGLIGIAGFKRRAARNVALHEDCYKKDA